MGVSECNFWLSDIDRGVFYLRVYLNVEMAATDNARAMWDI